MPVVLGVGNTALKFVSDSVEWKKAMDEYKRGDFIPSSIASTSATQVRSSKTGKGKRKAQHVITLPDDSDSSDSSKVIAKRPRLHSSSPRSHVTQSDSSDESSTSDSDAESAPAPPAKKTKMPTSKFPSQDNSAAATALAQILGALPAEFLQSVLPQNNTTGPVAGPSRLPHGSGSGSKGKKSGRKRSH